MQSQAVEGRFDEIPFVENVVVVGDKRKDVRALVTLNVAAVQAWANREGKKLGSNLLIDKEVRALISKQIEIHVNSTDRWVEHVKDFTIIPNLKTGEGLTPSIKVQRQAVLKTYATEVEALYAKKKSFWRRAA